MNTDVSVELKNQSLPAAPKEVAAVLHEAYREFLWALAGTTIEYAKQDPRFSVSAESLPKEPPIFNGKQWNRILGELQRLNLLDQCGLGNDQCLQAVCRFYERRHGSAINLSDLDTTGVGPVGAAPPPRVDAVITAVLSAECDFYFVAAEAYLAQPDNKQREADDRYERLITGLEGAIPRVNCWLSSGPMGREKFAGLIA